MMSRISVSGRGLLEKACSLRSSMSGMRRSYSKDEKEKEKELDADEQYKARKGNLFHDKQQSIQEESYFHKEEVEQLKGLKKKLINEKEEKKNDDKKN